MLSLKRLDLLSPSVTPLLLKTFLEDAEYFCKQFNIIPLISAKRKGYYSGIFVIIGIFFDTERIAAGSKQLNEQLVCLGFSKRGYKKGNYALSEYNGMEGKKHFLRCFRISDFEKHIEKTFQSVNSNPIAGL